jgi:predicted alpha/beta-hydrolase family hydrolase
VRYNLPYRRRRPKGPPSGSVATDRAGILEAIAVCRDLADGPVIAGGHSYGGRQTSMVVAEDARPVDVLTLFSYPVHPPGKPERARTEHLPDIVVPTVFTHGTSDPFGTLDEVRAAAALISAPTDIVEITARDTTWARKPLTFLSGRRRVKTVALSVVEGNRPRRRRPSRWSLARFDAGCQTPRCRRHR